MTALSERARSLLPVGGILPDDRRSYVVTFFSSPKVHQCVLSVLAHMVLPHELPSPRRAVGPPTHATQAQRCGEQPGAVRGARYRGFVVCRSVGAGWSKFDQPSPSFRAGRRLAAGPRRDQGGRLVDARCSHITSRKQVILMDVLVVFMPPPPLRTASPLLPTAASPHRRLSAPRLAAGRNGRHHHPRVACCSAAACAGSAPPRCVRLVRKEGRDVSS